MGKIVEYCEMCPYFKVELDNQNIERFVCAKTGKDLADEIEELLEIPDWCPLPKE